MVRTTKNERSSTEFNAVQWRCFSSANQVTTERVIASYTMKGLKMKMKATARLNQAATELCEIYSDIRTLKMLATPDNLWLG
jgi:hypothetical protein